MGVCVYVYVYVSLYITDCKRWAGGVGRCRCSYHLHILRPQDFINTVI